MSDGRIPSWESAQSAQRKRAAMTLGAIAVVAVLVVVAMLLLFNNSGDSGTQPPQAAAPSDTIAPLTSAPRTSRATTPVLPTTSVRATPSKTPPRTPSPTSTQLTCRTEPACILPGDPGNAVAALNAYRTIHGQLAITGSVSRLAQTCAVHSGDSPSCPQSYFWEPVSGHNGRQVISKIAAKSDGAQFLLDPSAKSVQVGWAYLPSSGGYECAIVTGY